MDENEERKGSSPSKEKTHNQIIRESGQFMSDREEDDILRLGRQFNDNEFSNEKGRKSMS